VFINIAERLINLDGVTEVEVADKAIIFHRPDHNIIVQTYSGPGFWDDRIARLTTTTVLPAAPGMECVIYWRGDASETGFHEIKPIIGWAVDMVSGESVALTLGNMDHFHNSSCTAGIILPNGKVDVPHESTYETLAAFLESEHAKDAQKQQRTGT